MVEIFQICKKNIRAKNTSAGGREYLAAIDDSASLSPSWIRISTEPGDQHRSNQPPDWSGRSQKKAIKCHKVLQLHTYTRGPGRSLVIGVDTNEERAQFSPSDRVLVPGPQIQCTNQVLVSGRTRLGRAMDAFSHPPRAGIMMVSVKTRVRDGGKRHRFQAHSGADIAVVA